MRRSRAVDRLLLLTLLPAYLLLHGYAVHSYLEHAGWWFPFSTTGAQGAAGYPIVDRVMVESSPLRVGDRVLRVGDHDLQGLSRAEARQLQKPLLRGGKPFRVEAERREQRFEAMVAPAPQPFWWWRALGAASLALAGAFLFLRAPHWHLSRRFFVAMLLLGSWAPLDLGQLAEVAAAVGPLGMALTLWSALEWTEAARPLRPWQRALPLAFAMLLGFVAGAYFLLTIPVGLWLYRFVGLSAGACFAATLAALVRAYRRAGALERRRVRWVLYGSRTSRRPYSGPLPPCSASGRDSTTCSWSRSEDC